MFRFNDRHFYLNGRKIYAVPEWDLYKIIESMEFGNSFFSVKGQFVPADMLESIFAEIYVFSPTFPESLPTDRLKKEWARIKEQIEATDIDGSFAFLISRDLYMRIYEELNEIRPSDDPDDGDEPEAANA